jgi:hypothetical protein
MLANSNVYQIYLVIIIHIEEHYGGEMIKKEKLTFQNSADD